MLEFLKSLNTKSGPETGSGQQGPRRINLACQGGGALGAFSWGVIDRLLEDDTIEIAAASGASAGAMNAAALASGLALGGRAGAKARLAAFWADVAQSSALPSMGGADAWPQSGLMRAFGAWMGAGLATPKSSETSLGKVVDRHIDFEALSGSDAILVIISATSLKTEQPRLFRGAEIDRAVMMASAALPIIHKPVEIGGSHYVDGGLSLNPPLVSLVESSQAEETLLIRLLPVGVPAVSTRPFAHVMNSAQMVFNRGLLSELDQWRRLKALAADPSADSHPVLSRLARHRLWQIDGSAQMPEGVVGQALNPSAGLIEDLHARGRLAAEDWLVKRLRDRLVPT